MGSVVSYTYQKKEKINKSFQKVVDLKIKFEK